MSALKQPLQRIPRAALLLTLGATLVSAFGINLMQLPEEDKSQVACTLALLRKYFSYSEAMSGSVMCVSILSSNREVQQRLLQALNEHPDHPWTLLTTRAEEKHKTQAELMEMHEKPQCYFLIVGNLDDEDIEETFNNWKRMLNWNPFAQFVVFLATVEETDEEMTDLMVELMLTFMNNKLYNVNVIGQNEETSFFFAKTVFPYHPDNNCGNRVIAIDMLDACSYEGDGEEEDEEDEDEEGEEEEEGAEEGTEERTEEGTEERTEEGNEEGTEESVGEGAEEEGNGDGEEAEQEGNTGKEEPVKEENADEETPEQEENVDGEETEQEENIDERETQPDTNVEEEETKQEGNIEEDEQKKEENADGGETVQESNVDEEAVKQEGNDGEQPEQAENADNEEGEQENNVSGDEMELGENVGDNRRGKEENADKEAAEHEENVEEEVAQHGDNTDEIDEGEDNATGNVDYATYGEGNAPFARDELPDWDSESARVTIGDVEIEEFTRGRFEDKFPHDLSGCPIRAAYRGPWEPYIFSTSSQSEVEVESVTKPPPDAETQYGDETETEGTTAANDSDNNADGYSDGYANSYDESYTEKEEYNNVENVDQVDDNVAQKITLTGLEYQLVQTIAQRLHVNIDFNMQSSNVFHLFQQLIEGQIDVIVGGIDEDPSISQVVSSSTSYLQDELTWCVARAKRHHSFFNFLAGFKTNSLLLLLLFIIVSSLSVLAAQKVSRFRLKSLANFPTIFMRMFGILLTQAINVNALSLPLVLRMLLALAFYMGFFFSNTYQSFLISTLTTPTTQTQISHLHEIYENRMTIMVSSENVRHLDKDGETFKYIREKFEICYNIVDCLNNAADNEHIAVAVSRQHAFYNARIQRDKLYCFDRRESLYVYPVVMLLPRKFQLLRQINAIIQNVIESGHMQKWSRDLDMVRVIHEKIARAQEDVFKSLTLAQFHGAFAFASALLLLASCVFLLEWFVYWLVVKRRSRLKPLRCLHRRLR
ncbi:uncharacterized protein LOC132785217 [Drosophila nasuta]|uniref:uncharacterized protein LOC132785217 n=1 Tax=Drosophila nasuta TaxID=42062 RepID=UPI00295EBDD0|nr:uncharacterized protein LOC132785217 [Drosophila nasuta]